MCCPPFPCQVWGDDGDGVVYFSPHLRTSPHLTPSHSTLAACPPPTHMHLTPPNPASPHSGGLHPHTHHPTSPHHGGLSHTLTS